MAKTSQVDRALAEIDRQIAEVKENQSLRLLALEEAKRIILNAGTGQAPAAAKKPRKPRTMKPKAVAEVA